MCVSAAGLFEVPIQNQQKPSANNTLVATESVCQTILARPVATARSTWLTTATAKTRPGANLSGTAVGLTPFLSSGPLTACVGRCRTPVFRGDESRLKPLLRAAPASNCRNEKSGATTPIFLSCVGSELFGKLVAESLPLHFEPGCKFSRPCPQFGL